jgi:hypothetical protein
MTVVNSPELVLSSTEENLPIIGYENLVTTTNITSTTAADGFPITNVANPATHLGWEADTLTAEIETITITTGSLEEIDYVGIVGHNFGSDDITVSLYDGSSPMLVSGFVPDDDSPLIIRFTPAVITTLTITLNYVANSIVPRAAVIYVGKLLVLERSLDINSDYTPITYGRRSNIINGMSETGNFLGRIVLGEYRESKAEFKHFTADFYRSDVEPFVEAATGAPFFFAWAPDAYPAETGYAWLTSDAQPEISTVTRRVNLSLEMRGII